MNNRVGKVSVGFQTSDLAHRASVVARRKEEAVAAHLIGRLPIKNPKRPARGVHLEGSQ
jgi:hypothetical protein